MAIECQSCGSETEEVRYRIPSEDRALVQQFWMLLALAAGLAAFSAFRLLEDVMVIRQTIDEFVRVLIANPLIADARLKDGVRMAANAANLLGILAIVTMIAIPVRYLHLMFRVKAGHPSTLGQIKIIASLTLAIELGKFGAMWFISMHNEAIRLNSQWSLSFFTGLALLWYARLQPVEKYFSKFRLKKAEASPQPTPRAVQMEAN